MKRNHTKEVLRVMSFLNVPVNLTRLNGLDQIFHYSIRNAMSHNIYRNHSARRAIGRHKDAQVIFSEGMKEVNRLYVKLGFQERIQKRNIFSIVAVFREKVKFKIYLV
jgi:hypothetical protein